MCLGGCNGGSGTNGKGRTPYTPPASNATSYTGSRKTSSGGASRTSGKASEFGTPKVRVSFSSRTKK